MSLVKFFWLPQVKKGVRYFAPSTPKFLAIGVSGETFFSKAFPSFLPSFLPASENYFRAANKQEVTFVASCELTKCKRDHHVEMTNFNNRWRVRRTRKFSFKSLTICVSFKHRRANLGLKYGGAEIINCIVSHNFAETVISALLCARL